MERPQKSAHLQDEKNFLGDLQNRTLPAVSFIKPLGPDNEHPGYATLLAASSTSPRSSMRSPRARIGKTPRSSSPTTKTADVTITSHRPDRSTVGDRIRVPTIIISPWARRHFVDHTQYETISILAFIEKRGTSKPLNARDAGASAHQRLRFHAAGPNLAFDPIH